MKKRTIDEMRKELYCLSDNISYIKNLIEENLRCENDEDLDLLVGQNGAMLAYSRILLIRIEREVKKDARQNMAEGGGNGGTNG